MQISVIVMKRLLAGLVTAGSLLLAQPAIAQYVSQADCDVLGDALLGDSVALNSGWCHDVNEPFVFSIYYGDTDNPLLVIGEINDDDPVGTSRIALWTLHAEEPLLSVLVDGLEVTEYWTGDPEILDAYVYEVAGALVELTYWRPR